MESSRQVVNCDRQLGATRTSQITEQLATATIGIFVMLWIPSSLFNSCLFSLSVSAIALKEAEKSTIRWSQQVVINVRPEVMH